jgi:mono/diheme cytochrome c family protein
MRAYRSTIAFFIFFLSVATMALSAQPAASANLTANPIFQKDCAKCHGKTAEGRHFGGPSLISDKTSATFGDDLRNIITNGKGRMPKYASKLTSEEIATLVEQIRSLSKK